MHGNGISVKIKCNESELCVHSLWFYVFDHLEAIKKIFIGDNKISCISGIVHIQTRIFLIGVFYFWAYQTKYHIIPYSVN